MLNALDELEARYITRDIDPATGMQRTHPVSLVHIQRHPLLMLWTRYGFLDLFSCVPGCAEADVAQLFKDSVEGGGLRFPSKDWLIRMKTAAGRSKDLEDLRNLPE
jgi:hypothetical protein